MGLLLPDDVWWTDTEVVCRTGRLRFTGGALLDRLAPHLNGRRTIDELTAALSPARRDQVTRTLTALLDRGVLRDTAAVAGTPSATVTGADTTELAEAVRVALRRAGVPVVTAGGTVAIHLGGPAPTPADGPRWEVAAVGERAWYGALSSAWPRLRPAPPRPVTGIAATVLAAQLVRAATAGPPPDGSLAWLDLDTLAGGREAFLPPASEVAVRPDPAGARARFAALAVGERLTEEAFSRRAVRAVGPHLGPLGEPSERDYAQVPLHICGVPVRADGDRPAIGVGTDFAAARYRAVLAALARHAALTLDPRRLPLWGLDLVDGHLRPVTPPSATGVAAAYSFRDAVTAGLLAHARALALTGGVLRPLGPVPLDAVARRHAAVLAALGPRVELAAASGRVPTVVCLLDGVPTGAASGPTAADAARDALEQAVCAEQARRAGQTDYAPPPLPPLTVVDGLAVVPAPVPSGGLPAALAPHRPAVVLLDQDSEVNAVMPYTVQVVLDA